MADGSLKFDTKIDTDGFEKGTKTLKERLNSVISSLNKSGTEISRSFSGASSTIMRVEESLRSTEQAMEKLSSEMDAYASKQIPTTEYEEIKKQLDGAVASLGRLQGKQDRFLATGGKTSSKTYKNMQYDMEELSRSIRNSRGEMEHLVSSGKAFTLGRDTSTYTDMQTKFADLSRKADIYRQRLAEVDKQQNKASSSSRKLNTSLKKTAKTSVPLTKSILKLSNMFKLLILRMAMRAVIKSVQEGFENLAQYSNQTNKDISALKTSLQTLKNSFASAFAPILQTVVPILQTLIGYLSQAISVMGQFFAVLLTGATTFTKAKDAQVDYAKSLKDTAKAANKSLSPIDKLNAVGDTGGGGGYTGPSPAEMFEEVEIDNKIVNIVNDLKKNLSGLFEPIKQSWAKHGKSAVESMKTSFGSVKSLLGEIGKSFKTVWSNGTGTETIDNILMIFTNINTTISSIAENFKKAWVTDGTGTQIIQNILDMVNNILGVIQRITSATSEWASELDFTPILTSFERLTDALEPLTGTIADGLVWFYEEVLLPLAGWVITDIIPLFFDALAAALDVLNNILIALKPLGKWLFENFLTPLAEWTGGIIKDVLGWIVDKLRDFSDWIEDHSGIVEAFVIIVGSFAAAWGLVNAAIAIWNTIGVIATGVTTAFSAAVAFLTSPVTLVIAAIGALIAIIVLLVKNWDSVKEAAAKCWEAIKKAWSVAANWMNTKVIQPIGKFFSGLWNTLKSGATIALNGIKNAFKTVFNALVNIVRTPINIIISIINGMISGVVAGVNTVIKAINSISFTIPNWVPGIGGKGIGFNLKTLTAPKIPRLATGTVVPANYGEFMAILGDNTREAEVVSPLSTMKQAFKEALAENGGGNGNINLNVYLDGKQIHSEIVKQDKQYKDQTGRSAFAY